MDPQIIAYLNRISRSIGITLLWMVSNSTFGIMKGYAFIENAWHVGNVLFYIFLAISFFTLMFILYKIWKTPVGFKTQ